MADRLHPVSQSVDADTSGYVRAMRDALAANIAFSRSVDRDVLAKVTQIQEALKSLPDSKTIRIAVENADALGKIAAVKGALDGLPDSKEITVTVRYVTVGDRPDLGGVSGGVTVPAAGGGGGGADASRIGDLTRLLNDQADAADRAAIALGTFSDARRRLRITDATIDSATRYAAALNDITVAANNAAVPLAAAAALRGAGGNQAATAAAAAAVGTALAGGAGGPAGGGGGGGAGAAAVLAALGAAGRGGGGGPPGGPGGGTPGGGGGGFVPWAGGGWQAVRFWGMMGAEIASTVIPAVVAAGSAALVGAQGFEQLQNRMSAVYTVSEALGPSMGQTFGSFVVGGKYGNALQNAQNLATGGVYQLAGAAINLARTGAGGGLLQEGTSTLSMIDRGVANMVLNFQQQGTGTAITQMLGGGTGYLRQFGDIGANLGGLLLGVAPNLPGVGSDLLTTITGGTGALAAGVGGLNKFAPEALKGFFAYEAASRWGPALLGGRGLIGRMLGLRGVGGIGGLLGRVGLGGAGDFLAGLGGPELGVLGAAAALIGQGIGYQSPATQQMAQLQAGVSAGGFTGAWQPLAKAITTATGLAQQKGPAYLSPWQGIQKANADLFTHGNVFGGFNEFWRSVGSEFGLGRGVATPKGAAQTELQLATNQMKDLVQSGPQLVSLLQGLGMHGVTMAQGFQVAQNALLDLTHAFDKGGKLTPTAVQQVKDYASAILPMTQSFGAFGAAVAGQQIMSSGAMKNLSQVNQAMDSMTQIMSAGPVGMANLFGILGGAPVTSKPTRAGYQLAVPPAMAQMAQNLTSFITPTGAAAWRTFAGPQGLIASEQANLDQLRTALTLGAMSQPQAAGLAGFQIQQMLPLAKQSPAALAMLMQQGAQMGITGYYDASKSQAANYQNAVNATAKIADNTTQANAATNRMTVNLSNLPQVAQQFAQGMNATVLSQRVAQASQDVIKLQDSALKGGKVNTGALQDWITQAKAAGVQGSAALKAALTSSLQGLGIPSSVINSISSQLSKALGGAKPVKVPVTADTSHAQSQLDAVHPKPVKIPVQASPPPSAIQAGINAITGKTVTVTEVIQVVGAVGLGSVRTVSPSGVLGSVGGRSAPGGQSGMIVPGYGGGDIYPAMLEPGETVLPKHATSDPMTAMLGAKYKVPGFQSGGVVGYPTMLPGMVAGWVDAFLKPLLDSFGQMAHFGVMNPVAAGRGPSVPVPVKIVGQPIAGAAAGGSGHPGMAGNPGGPMLPGPAHAAASGFIVQIVKAMGDSIPGAKGEVAKLAQKIVSQLTTEVHFAKQVSAQTMQGLNLGGINTSQTTVGQAMSDYLGSVKSFTTDLATLSKQGLNKGVLQQLIQAGPQVGDQLAQSILHGAQQSISQQAKAGLNLAGMDVTPGTGQGTVQEQMQSYLTSLQNFSGDIKNLSKQGLNKDVMQQLIAAGPQQGDALAQSILGGPGGVKAVNQLWAQIGKAADSLGAAGAGALGGSGVKDINSLWNQLTQASKGLGAQAAMSMYGGILAPDLKSATVTTNNISVNISAPPGAGTTLDLSPSQMKQLVSQIQAALQKQARNNRKTGVKHKGKST